MNVLNVNDDRLIMEQGTQNKELLMSKYNLDEMRKAMKAKAGGGRRDPLEFVPPKAKPGQTINYRFYVLPPYQEGDTLAEGPASKTLELFFLRNGAHWINKRPVSACPRIHEEDAECPLCDLAFELMNEAGNDKKRKSEIARNYLPPQKNAMNIYFPKDQVNPEELWGKTLWFNASKTVIDIAEACLMRDDGGDPNDPKPFGVFYDEDAAYLFQLQIEEKGGYNDYSKSKFLVPVGRRPIVCGKQGNEIVPIPAKIQAILAARHDLYTKFDAVDHAKIKAAVAAIMNQDTNATPGSGFDEDEQAAGKGNAVVSESVGTVSGEGAEVEKPKPTAKPAQKATTAPKTTTAAKPAAAAPKATVKPTAPAPVAPVEEIEEVGEATAVATVEPGEEAELDALLGQINDETTD